MKGDQIIADMMGEAVPSKVMFGWFISFIAGLLGAVVGTYVGWGYDKVFGGGVHVIVIAAILGFLVSFTIAFCLSGPFQYHFYKWACVFVPMEGQRRNLTGKTGSLTWQSFDLYVTIHSVRNMYTDDMFGLTSQNNHYVECKVGRKIGDDKTFSMQRNPIKRTCVQMSGVFEETFHFEISPTDDTIRFVLYDQDIFTDDVHGQCDVNITNQVLAEGFPQKLAVKLFHGTKKRGDNNYRDTDMLVGNILVSFTPGANFSDVAKKTIRDTNPYAFTRMKEVGEKFTKADRGQGDYGSMA